MPLFVGCLTLLCNVLEIRTIADDSDEKLCALEKYGLHSYAANIGKSFVKTHRCI